MSDADMIQLGQYQIIEKLGQGGMATVYKAYQPSMERTVAVKVLPRALKLDPEFTDRFRQEAKIVASLEHARILPVHDFGEENNCPYLVMRFLEGGTLHERIQRDGPLPLGEAARILRQIAEGLHYAHGKDIIHRDMTSNNVMFDAAGSAYITDFGLAKMVGGSAHLTGHSIVGTPSYIAPEQALGEKPGPRSDIYSLGVVLYEILVGDVPFHGDTPMAVMFKHVNEPLPDPLSRRPDLPDAVAAVIEQATAKEPQARYESALAMAEALDYAVSGDTKRLALVRVPPETAAEKTQVSTPTKSMQRPRMAEEPTRPIRTGGPGWLVPALLGGIVVLALVAVGVLLGGRLSGSAPQQAADTSGSAPAAIAGAPTVEPAETVEMAEPTLAPAPTEEAAAADMPPTPEEAGLSPSFHTADADELSCEGGEVMLFAVNFGSDEPGEMDLFTGPAAGYVSLEGDWLTMTQMPRGQAAALHLPDPAAAPRIAIVAVWNNPNSVFGVMAGAGPEVREPYGFLIGRPGVHIVRGPDLLDTASDYPDFTDGEPHGIEFTVEGATLTGLIDGQVVASAQASEPVPPGDVALFVEAGSINIDTVTVCDAVE